MKKVCVLICFLAMMLGGCAAEQTFETVTDVLSVSSSAQRWELEVSLPEKATAPAMVLENEDRLYICDGYYVMIQTMEGGDLERSVRQVSGFDPEELSVVGVADEKGKRYNFAWCSAGEGGDDVCRCVLLDDGNYHYCVTVMSDAASAGGLTDVWSDILGSVKLTRTD